MHWKKPCLTPIHGPLMDWARAIGLGLGARAIGLGLGARARAIELGL